MASREELAKNVEIAKWLDGFADRTKYVYLESIFHFTNETGLSPNNLLTLAEQNPNECLDRIQSYVQKLKGRRKTKIFHYSCILSFLRSHRKSLPQDPAFMRKLKGDQPPVVGRLSRDILHRCYEAAGPRDRSWIAVAATSVCGEKELVQISDKGREVWEAVTRGEKIVKVEYPKLRKNNPEPYYAILQGVAIDALKQYFMKERGEVKEDEALWISKERNPFEERNFRDAWRSILIQIGERPSRKANKGKPRGTRYGNGPHEIRDCSRTAWTQSGANPIVAEFLMGHIVDKNNYDKFWGDFEWTSQEHAKALAYLDPNSHGTYVRIGDQDQKIAELEKTVALLKDAIEVVNSQLPGRGKNLEELKPHLTPGTKISVADKDGKITDITDEYWKTPVENPRKQKQHSDGALKSSIIGIRLGKVAYPFTHRVLRKWQVTASIALHIFFKMVT